MGIRPAAGGETVRLPSRILASTVIAAAVVLAGCTDAEPAPRAPSADELRREIATYLADDDTMHGVRSVIVVVGDRPLVEEYYGTTAEEYRNVFSVTTSVLSTLVGIAVDQRLLDLDDPLRDLLPDYADEMSPEVGDTTLQQLLTMSGGFSDTATGRPEDLFTEPDWVAACLASRSRPAGRFSYADRGAHLVAAALARATGRSVLDYAREVLFDPLGVETRPAAGAFAWPADPQGIEHGWGNLTLRPRDMAALGRLYLHGGTFDGEQVVSTTWVRDATAMHVPASGAADGYGYLWWVGELDGSPAYLAVGLGGQLVAVLPDRDLVVVVSTDVGRYASVDVSSTTYLVDSVIAPAVARS